VIQDFLSSWPLFHNTYLAGWLVTILLSLVGVVVVARDQIFIGAAISQASTLGIALAMWIGASTADSGGGSDLLLAAMAVSFSVIAALLTSRGGGFGVDSHEAITGWVFLASSSLSILIVSRSPHGLEEIHRLLASSIIGATRFDVGLFGVLASLTTTFLALAHRPLLLFVMDPVMAEAVGMKTRWWAAATSVWLGLVIGLSIRVSGALYAFGCLVLPALIAKNLCREVAPMFFVAPLVALSAAVAGFALANHYDTPPAQMTVAIYGALLTFAWLDRWRRGGRR
jgi:ABC-type Mn2+/Zn2+ transport system permease subunit